MKDKIYRHLNAVLAANKIALLDTNGLMMVTVHRKFLDKSRAQRSKVLKKRLF